MTSPNTGAMAAMEDEARVLVEESVFLLSQQSLTLAALATRLGQSPAALDHALRRAERLDLLARLKTNRAPALPSRRTRAGR